MAKNSIYDYSTSAGSNSDIAGIGILGTNAVLNFDDAFRTIMAQIATDVSPRRLSIQGEIFGLTLANNAGDATNDIDIAVGMATTDSTTDPRTMVLASALTKRLDATWAVGTNQGGLDTGTVADGTYHVFLIQRSDTGVVDALFSTSATSPTMPTNYDRKRRIGSILRASSTIRPFRQIEDRFILTTIPAAIRSSTAAATDILVTCVAPTGIKVQPMLLSDVAASASSVVTNIISDGDANIASVSFQTVSSNQRDVTNIAGIVFTNTSAQIRWTTSIVSGSIVVNVITSVGWVDTRGRIS